MLESYSANSPDSTLCSIDGQPLHVFHGTHSNFDAFAPSPGWFGHGIYFTDNHELATEFADEIASELAGPGRILTVVLKMVTPYIFEERAMPEASNVQLMRLLGLSDMRINRSIKDIGAAATQITRSLQERGHDGVIVRTLEGPTEFIVFSNEQVRIVDDTNCRSAPARIKM